VKPIWSIINIL